MKAAVVEELGRAPVYADVADPVSTDDLVVADVRAAAVKNIERALVAGTHYSSGRIELPGLVGVDAVVAMPNGRLVYTGASPPDGTMAERVLVNPDLTVELPDGVDEVSAAALPNPGASAWLALEYAGRAQPGQSVLVLGATGVTGSLAVQLAKRRFGAHRVVAVGRSAERLERSTQFGADATITLAAPDIVETEVEEEIRRLHAECPFDLVLDYLWGRPAEQALRALANDDLEAGFHRIRYVQIGEMAGRTIELPAGVLRSTGIELVGQGGGSVPEEAFARMRSEILPELFAMLAEGSVSVRASPRPLSDVTNAWTASMPSGDRVVLTP